MWVSATCCWITYQSLFVSRVVFYGVGASWSTNYMQKFSRLKQFPDSRSSSSSSSFFFSLCLPFCISAAETSVSHICSWSSGTMTGTIHGCERVSYENHWLPELFLVRFTVESVWSLWKLTLEVWQSWFKTPEVSRSGCQDEWEEESCFWMGKSKTSGPVSFRIRYDMFYGT